MNEITNIFTSLSTTVCVVTSLAMTTIHDVAYETNTTKLCWYSACD